MKTTFSVTIGGRNFNIDNDAFDVLDRYLKEISARLDGDQETMTEIENRIADIISENLPSEMQVVCLELVRKVIGIIGSPEAFGNDRGDRQRRDFSYQQVPYSSEPKKLYRSNTNKVFAGICGGFGEYLDVDPVILRVIAVILMFITFSVAFFAYLVLWVVIPQEPVSISYNKRRNV